MNYHNPIKIDGIIYNERGDSIDGKLNKYFIVERYKWIIKRLKKYKINTVLDYGCGLGYGTYLINKEGFNVVGFDISDDSVIECSKRYPKIKFINKALFMKNHYRYDAIVASEVLEHVKDPQLLLASIINHLNAWGLILLTTPNRKYLKNINPHHVHEFTYSELKTLIPTASINGFMSIFVRGLRYYSLFIPPPKAYQYMIKIERFFLLHKLSSYCRYFLIELKKNGKT